MESNKETAVQSGNRGEQARHRLLKAGLKVFGEMGYEGASTRQIAREAGVNLSAITYHFGSKERLYHFVVESMVGQIDAPLVPVTEQINTAFAHGTVSRDDALALLEQLIDTFAVRLLGIEDAQANRIVLIWIREQMTPSAAFDVLFERMARSLVFPGCRLIAFLLGTSPDAPECRVRMFFLIGQVLVFRIARAAVQRAMNWDTYTEERIALVRALIRQHVATQFPAREESLALAAPTQ